MQIYIPQETDITIPLKVDDGVVCGDEDREKILSVLEKLYQARSIINLVRSIAICPISYEPCITASGQPISRCSLIKKSPEVNIIVPVQWLHILREHRDILIDESMITHFAQ